jgi:hypothetical protein
VGYPLLATAAKDNSIKLWKHTSAMLESELDAQARIYQQIALVKPHKEPIRAILWKERWTEAQPLEYELFTCS